MTIIKWKRAISTVKLYVNNAAHDAGQDALELAQEEKCHIGR